MEDVEMTAVLAQPASERTCEICGVLVHADIADRNSIEEELRDVNMKGEVENENAGGLAAISVRNAATPDGWQPELLVKGKVVYGHKSGQRLPEDTVREARGREVGLMADHGMYDIVVRDAARGKLGRAKWLDDWREDGQQFNWAKRDDVTQNTPPLVAARLLVSKASSFGRKVGAVSLSTTRRLMRTLLSSRRKGCAPWDSCGSFDGP